MELGLGSGEENNPQLCSWHSSTNNRNPLICPDSQSLVFQNGSYIHKQAIEQMHASSLLFFISRLLALSSFQYEKWMNLLPFLPYRLSHNCFVWSCRRDQYKYLCCFVLSKTNSSFSLRHILLTLVGTFIAVYCWNPS